jgi:hypothetical protein
MGQDPGQKIGSTPHYQHILNGPEFFIGNPALHGLKVFVSDPPLAKLKVQSSSPPKKGQISCLAGNGPHSDISNEDEESLSS